MRSNQHLRPAANNKPVTGPPGLPSRTAQALRLPLTTLADPADTANRTTIPALPIRPARHIASAFISAARRALSLTIAVTYSNRIPDRWTRCRMAGQGSMLGQAPVRAVSNRTADVGWI